MVRKLHILLLGLILILPGKAMLAQDDALLIDWKVLSKVEFKDKYYEEYEAWYLYPDFPESIKKLDKQRIIIKGYIIPLDVESGIYALSAYPFSSCFFCGAAGPESVMSLKFKAGPPRYDTDDVIQVSGILELNSNNVEEFNYILREVEEL